MKRLTTTATALTAAALLTACSGGDPDAQACDTALTPFQAHTDAVQAWVDAPEDDKPDIDRDGLDVMPAALDEASEQVEDPALARMINNARSVTDVNSQDFFLAMGLLERACEG